MRGLRYDSPACTCRTAWAISAAANRAKDIIVRIVGREDDDARARAREGRDAVGGIGVRQLEVQQDDVRAELRRQPQPLGDRPRRPHDVDVPLALEHHRHALANDRMIVDEQDFNHGGPGGP